MKLELRDQGMIPEGNMAYPEMGWKVCPAPGRNRVRKNVENKPK